MARSFDDASSQYIEISSGIVTAMPLTMACWYYSDDDTIQQVLMQLCDKDVADHRYRLVLAGNVGGDPLRANSAQGATVMTAAATVGYTKNTWQHGCAIFAASNDARAFLNGANKGTSSAPDTTPAGIDRFSIGRDGDSTPGVYMSGMIAEAAIWDAALTDAEVASLGKGISPLAIRPGNLVAYWPLIGNNSPETDSVGKFELTVTGATKAVHPRMFHPGAKR